MLQITVKITGTREVIDKLRRLDVGLFNFSEAMSDIGDEVKSYFSGQVFASQGGVIGVVWPTLAVSTMLYKRKHYPQYATTPLIRTGAMQGSFTSAPTSNSVTISNSAPYFKYHQSSAPRTKIPYRPMMAINDDVTNTVRRILQVDIASKIESA
jgi:phage gpG-like protein